MPRTASRRGRASHRPQIKLATLPQIGERTELCRGTENALNELGSLGWLLETVILTGHNNRHSQGMFINTTCRWEYKVIQFNTKDPSRAELIINELGQDGWLLRQVYAQGSHNFAQAAVLIRAVSQEEPESTEGNTGHVTEGALATAVG